MYFHIYTSVHIAVPAKTLEHLGMHVVISDVTRQPAYIQRHKEYFVDISLAYCTCYQQLFLLTLSKVGYTQLLSLEITS